MYFGAYCECNRGEVRQRDCWYYSNSSNRHKALYINWCTLGLIVSVTGERYCRILVNISLAAIDIQHYTLTGVLRGLWVVPPLNELAGHRPLQAFDLGFQSGVAGDLPPPPPPVLQAYFVLNAGRYRRPWPVTWATFGSRCRQGLQDDPGEVLNACVDCHPVLQYRVERNLIVQVSIEVGPVSATEIRTIRLVLKDERHAMSMSTGMVQA